MSDLLISLLGLLDPFYGGFESTDGMRERSRSTNLSGDIQNSSRIESVLSLVKRSTMNYRVKISWAVPHRVLLNNIQTISEEQKRMLMMTRRCQRNTQFIHCHCSNGYKSESHLFVFRIIPKLVKHYSHPVSGLFLIDWIFDCDGNGEWLDLVFFEGLSSTDFEDHCRSWMQPHRPR